MNFEKETVENIKRRYASMRHFLTDERLKRTWAASEAKILGHGGLKVSENQKCRDFKIPVNRQKKPM